MNFKGIALLFFLYSHHTLANDVACYQTSPSLQQTGDDYYDLGVDIRLDKALVQQSVEMARSLKGSWHGTISDLYCYGSDNNPKTKTSTSKVVTVVNTDAENPLTLDLEWIVTGKASNKQEQIQVITQQQLFQLSLSKDYLQSVRKVRAGSGFSNNRIRESIITMNIDKRQLKITIDYYSQGYFESRRVLQLRR